MTAPPPPPTDISAPQSQPSDYYSPSQPSNPPPTSTADLPSSPSPPSTLPSPASQPPSAPLDAYSPRPHDDSPPSASSPPPPTLYPPHDDSPPPPLLPLSPPPAAIPPMSPIYYQSPPPPPPLPPSSPPPALPSPCPLASPPKAASSPPPPPVPHRSPPLLPLPAPVKPNNPSPSNPTKDTGFLHRSGSSLKSSSGTVGPVATVAVVASLVVLTFVGAAVWLVKKRKKPFESIRRGRNLVTASTASSHASESSHARSQLNPLVRHGSGGSSRFPYSPSDIGLGHTKLWFTLEELSMITSDFSARNLLGEGGCSCVYKGRLLDGREVAVKQLKVGGEQGEREFRAEVETISRVHHRHLVSLVGYCIPDNQRLLVYDYVPNKTLYYHLHGKGTSIMEWTTRVKVAVGAARGIAYLHEDCHPRIIHRDIKSSNILLDYNFEAKVSDFGLARSAMDANNSHVTTRVMGTFGYLAPEYATSGKLTYKSDVFSFGVVLLELITGRKSVDTSQPLGDESLVEWARRLLIQAVESGDFGCLPDPRLDGNYNKDEMFRIIEIAAACTRHSSTMRPHMGYSQQNN